MIKLFSPEPTREEMIRASEVVANSDKLARGEQIGIFEGTLANSVDMDHAVALSSGTTAMHAAVNAMGWGNGDKILTSPYSFIATSNALLYEGCEPVFGRIGNNLQLDLQHAREVLETNPDIKGLLIPNIFGHQADMETLAEIREQMPHIGIIEDASQALATGGYGLGIGRFSDIVTYSFHENKIVTTFGEGGAIATNDEELAERIRSFHQHGRLDTPNWLDEITLGYNYRLSEVQAAVGTYQLQRLPQILEKRQQIAAKISDGLRETGLELPNPVLRSWFGFYVIAASPEEADHMTKDLLEKGVQSKPCPMPALTEFAHNKPFTLHENGTAERAQSVVMLPLHTRLNDNDIEAIVDSVKEWAYKSVGRAALSSVQFYDRLADRYGEVKLERSEYITAINKLAIEAIGHNGSGPNPGLILDIGCGDGKRGAEIAQATGCSLQAMDSSPSMVKMALENGVEARVLDAQDLKAEQEYNIVLMLWNVLGHVSNDQRETTIRNVYNALSQNGLLILDVNNLLNEVQYGKENVMRNAQAIQDNFYGSGDFVAKRIVDGSTIATVSHIFHEQEIIDLLEDAGFEISQVSFVNYSDGSITNENSGQIFIVAKKGDEQK